MSDTPEPSLSSTIETAQQSAPATPAPGVPNLSKIMESVAAQNAPSDAQRSDAAPAGATETQAVAQPGVVSIRDALLKRGFQIPETLSNDDAVLDQVVSMIDAANEVRSDDGFQEFQKSRGEFDQWRRSRMSAGQDATKAAAETASEQTTAQKPAQRGLSAEARLLQQHGMITKQENGLWSPVNAQYQAAADEVNAFEAKTRSASLKLVTAIAEYDSPEDWIADVVKKHLASGSAEQPSTIKELQDLKKQLDADKVQKREAEVQQWVASNAPKLFVDGDASKGLSKYGEAYRHFEQSAPSDVQNDSLARHQWVMKLMAPVEQMLSAPPSTASQEPAPKPSLLGSAASRTNGSANRLSGFSGAAATQSQPQPVVGKGKMPSLSTTIAQVVSSSP